MARFLVTTLGCKVNQYDGCAIAAALRRAGLCAAGPAQRADLVVINTCCVTATAMRKSRNAIRRAVRGAPRAKVLVAGCYGDYDAGAIWRVLGELGIGRERAIVAGHHDDLKGGLERLVARLLRRGEGAAGGAAPDGVEGRGPSLARRRKTAVDRGRPAMAPLGPVDRFDGHQRAFVKVQDGCDAFCTYCVVPYTRAVVWSRGEAEVVTECARLVAAGHKEIVLTGVFLGAFGRHTAVRHRWNGSAAALVRLLERVASIDGLWRVRLSSLEPQDLSEEFLAVCRDLTNFAPHFHLPLQSGSNRILRRMNRQYTAEQFRRAVDRARGALDRPAFTTDVIVGFPGEREADFAETLSVARHAGFAKIHAFPFSAIPGTVAPPGGGAPR